MSHRHLILCSQSGDMVRNITIWPVHALYYVSVMAETLHSLWSRHGVMVLGTVPSPLSCFSQLLTSTLPSRTINPFLLFRIISTIACVAYCHEVPEHSTLPITINGETLRTSSRARTVENYMGSDLKLSNPCICRNSIR